MQRGPAIPAGCRGDAGVAVIGRDHVVLDMLGKLVEPADDFVGAHGGSLGRFGAALQGGERPLYVNWLM